MSTLDLDIHWPCTLWPQSGRMFETQTSLRFRSMAFSSTNLRQRTLKDPTGGSLLMSADRTGCQVGSQILGPIEALEEFAPSQDYTAHQLFRWPGLNKKHPQTSERYLCTHSQSTSKYPALLLLSFQSKKSVLGIRRYIWAHAWHGSPGESPTLGAWKTPGPDSKRSCHMSRTCCHCDSKTCLLWIQVQQMGGCLALWLGHILC